MTHIFVDHEAQEIGDVRLVGKEFAMKEIAKVTFASFEVM